MGDGRRTRSQAAKPSAGLTPEREREIDELFSMEMPAAASTEGPRSAEIRPAEPEPRAGGALPPVGQIFGTADGDGRPQFPELPELQRGFQEIVRDLFEDGFDVLAEYRAIRESLSIKGALTPGTIQAAANETERMADRAFRLYCVALNEHDAYLREIAVIEAALRDSATAHLEREKAQKIRTKMITEGDIAATIAQLHPDEWERVQLRKNHAERMLSYIGNLSTLAKSRCFSVSKMQKD